MGAKYMSDFKVFNGTDYDQHYFSTTADQVKRNNGSTVETSLAELPDIYFLQSNIVVFTWDDIPSGLSGTLRSHNFPEGFTKDNCVAVSASYCQPSAGTAWQYDSKIKPAIGTGGGISVVIDTTGNINAPYTAKLVVMKVS